MLRSRRRDRRVRGWTRLRVARRAAADPIGQTRTALAGGSAERHAAARRDPRGDGRPAHGVDVRRSSKLYLGDTNRDGTPDTRQRLEGLRLRPRRPDLDDDVDGPLQAARRRGAERRLPRRQRRHRQLVRQEHPPASSSASPRDARARRSTTRSQGGSFTIMLDIEELGAGADYNPLVTKLYGGANLGMGTRRSSTAPTCGRSSPSCSSTGDISTTRRSSSRELRRRTTPGSRARRAPSTLALSIAGFTLEPRRSAARVITMELDADHKTAHERHHRRRPRHRGASSRELAKVAGAFDQSFCDRAADDREHPQPDPPGVGHHEGRHAGPDARSATASRSASASTRRGPARRSPRRPLRLRLIPALERRCGGAGGAGRRRCGARRRRRRAVHFSRLTRRGRDHLSGPWFAEGAIGSCLGGETAETRQRPLMSRGRRMPAKLRDTVEIVPG